MYTSEAYTRRLETGELRVCVVGLGRIGLPTAALFAEAGALVIGADIDMKAVEDTNARRCRFTDEPNLADMVKRVVSRGRLHATSDVSEAAEMADVVILCTPTPVDEAKSPDYSCIVKACQDVGRTMKRRCLVIVESTVGPGIVENLVLPLLEKESGLRAGVDFGLASCPERSDPGNIVNNMKHVPRIVGGIDKASADAAEALYNRALGVKVVKVSDPKTANAVKLTENLFRDVNIALANEFALLYSKLGIDTVEVVNACATKYNFMPHYPGAGVGGPCLPSNPYYLIVEGLKIGNIPHLVRMAREINEQMPDRVVDLISDALNEVGKTVKGSSIAVLGVAYKPDVKDLQFTPLKKICARLLEMGASIMVYDPYFRGEEVFGILSADTIAGAAKGADCILIGTAHKEFRNMNLQALRHIAADHVVLVDGRNVIPPEVADKAGFTYRAVGRPMSRALLRSQILPHAQAGGGRRRE